MKTEVRQVPFGRPIIENEEKDAVMQVLGNPILVHGPKAKEFEQSFASFTKAPYAVSVSSCTAGLHLSYFCKEISSGDEVIVPAQTHVATAHAVELSGAKPVFVDAEIETGNIDISQIEKAITDRTRAISVVHYLGMPVAMDKVMEIAKKHGLFVVEDCALAIGTWYKGTHAGLFGDVGCYSFYPVKHMTTGEGGMMIMKDDAFAKAVERKKAFGVNRHMGERKVPGVYDVTMLGFNYRMNEISAVLGIEQMKRVPGFLSKRKENYEALSQGLSEISELSQFRSSHGDFQSSYYCLSVLLNEKLAPKRFEIVEILKSRGVGTSVYYPQAVPDMSYYKEKYGFKTGQFEIASRISNTSIALPVGPHLSIEDMNYIVETMKQAIGEVK